MSAIPKEKRRKVILVALLTVGILVGLWFGLINLQRESLEKQAGSIDAARRKLENARRALAGATQLEAELAAESQRLTAIEDSMASPGDLFGWLTKAVRQFNASYPTVDIQGFSEMVEGETTLLPKLPYRQVRMKLSGNGFFHDTGKFISDFENQFPYIRLENLEIEPPPAASGTDKEKLLFRMDIVALIKPSSSAKPGPS